MTAPVHTPQPIRPFFSPENIMSKKSAPSRMSPIARAARTLAVLASVAAPGLALAEDQLTFPDAPPISVGGGTTTKIITTTNTVTETKVLSGGVKPNIILSIDDSGSMSIYSDVEDMPGTTRIAALKTALRNTFSKPQYVNKFRLGFQALWNNRGFGSGRFFTKSTDPDNRLRLFDATQQTNFLKWVDTLTGTGDRSSGMYSTPSQLLMIYAGEYLNRQELSTSNIWLNNNTRLSFTPVSTINNPWNANPGVTADTNQLTCRRAYHIFMTDGMWNMENYPKTYWIGAPYNQNYNGLVYLFMPYVSDVSGGTTASDANYDGNTHGLPDSTYTYTPTYPIYADSWPYPVATSSAYTHPYSVNGQPNSTDYVCGTAPYGTSYSFANDSSPGKGKGCSSTLADFSLYYWAKNLSGNSRGNIPQINMPGSETVSYGTGTNVKSFTYPEFWNPKNDPATWQHMQTYTIGYGKQANGGAGEINGNSTLPKYDSFYGGDFYKKFASGAVSWPAAWGAADQETPQNPGNLYDLVHAAYNGRGKFYAATTQAALEQAFADILQIATSQSITDTSTPVDDIHEEPPSTTTSSTGGIASAAGSSTQLAGGMAYTAGYDYKTTQTNNGLGGWVGSLTAYSGDDPSGTPKWISSISLPRTIFTAQPGTCTPTPPTTTCIPPPPTGTTLIGAGMTSAFSTTLHNMQVLGDIVNSQLVYVGKPPALGSLNAGYIKFAQAVNGLNGGLSGSARNGMIYVGANDGMMHAFDAGAGTPGSTGDGKEVFAYVPLGLQSRVSAIGSDTNHHWGVDGGMFSGDAQLCSSCYGIGTNSGTYGSIDAAHQNWATVLVGTLGAGGSGYFVLDVTDPTKIDESATATSPTGALTKAVLVDTTSPTAQATLGYQFGQPVMDQYNSTMQSAQIVQINTNDPTNPTEWAVIMGNGYKSTNSVPVLLIQSLSHTDRPPYKVEASCYPTGADCVKAGNGLGQPRAVDVDGNGTVDIVYAGDLMGNLWKFDISDIDNTHWKVASSTPTNITPLFHAVGPTGVAQPITSAPVVVPNIKGGFVVGFGTGKNLTQADTQDAPTTANAPLNSFYALYDTQKMSVETKDVTGASPARKVSQIKLDLSAASFCTAGLGGARYNCLYPRVSNSLPVPPGGSLNLDWVVSNTPNLDAEPFGGASGRSGWYFDIPEIDNGNAAKVLSNPMMMRGNIVVFFADNVASGQSVGTGGTTTETTTAPQPDVVTYSPDQATYDAYAAIAAGTGTPAANSAESCDEQKATKTTKKTTTTTEIKTEPGTTVKPLLMSVNYFNLMNGSLPDNITINIGGVPYKFDNTVSPADPSNPNPPPKRRGNRFRITGTMGSSPSLVRDGPDELTCVGVACKAGLTAPLPAGRRAGWRFSR